MTEFGGYRVGRSALYVGSLPGRKQLALYVQHGGLIRPLAYFKSEDKAIEAKDMIDKIAAATLEVSATQEVER